VRHDDRAAFVRARSAIAGAERALPKAFSKALGDEQPTGAVAG
jgi:hypothetical protein